MKKLLMILFVLTFTLPAFSSEEVAMDFSNVHSDGLQLKSSEELDAVINYLKSSKQGAVVKIVVSKASGTDSDGSEIDTELRSKQITLLRALRVRDYMRHSLDNPEIKIQVVYEMLGSNQLRDNLLLLNIETIPCVTTLGN